jgi:hypothetical protein
MTDMELLDCFVMALPGVLKDELYLSILRRMQLAALAKEEAK